MALKANKGTSSSRASSTGRAKASPKAAFNRSLGGVNKGVGRPRPGKSTTPIAGQRGPGSGGGSTGSGTFSPIAPVSPKPSGGGVAFPGPMPTYSSKAIPRFNKGTGKKGGKK